MVFAGRAGDEPAWEQAVRAMARAAASIAPICRFRQPCKPRFDQPDSAGDGRVLVRRVRSGPSDCRRGRGTRRPCRMARAGFFLELDAQPKHALMRFIERFDLEEEADPAAVLVADPSLLAGVLGAGQHQRSAAIALDHHPALVALVLVDHQAEAKDARVPVDCLVIVADQQPRMDRGGASRPLPHRRDDEGVLVAVGAAVGPALR